MDVDTRRVVHLSTFFTMPAAAAINDLRIPPSNHLELLKGKLAGYYSIRVNAQYRLIFHWSQQQQEAYDVYFDDYHH